MPRCERERSPIANSGRIKVPDREVHVDTVVNACVQVPATAVVGRADNFGFTRRRGGEHDVVGPHHGDGIGWSGTVEVDRPQHGRGVIRDGEEARRAHEGRHEVIDRLVVHLGRRPQLSDPSVPHHGDAITDRQRLLLVVGDEHGRCAGCLQCCGHIVTELDAQIVIEAGEGLVEQHERRRWRKRSGERHSLAFAAGELVREAITEAGEIDELEELIDTGLTFVGAEIAQPEADVVGDGEVREERVLLEHQPGGPAFWRQILTAIVDERPGE